MPSLLAALLRFLEQCVDDALDLQLELLGIRLRSRHLKMVRFEV